MRDLYIKEVDDTLIDRLQKIADINEVTLGDEAKKILEIDLPQFNAVTREESITALRTIRESYANAQTSDSAVFSAESPAADFLSTAPSDPKS